jgi:hypothetical protein
MTMLRDTGPDIVPVRTLKPGVVRLRYDSRGVYRIRRPSWRTIHRLLEQGVFALGPGSARVHGVAVPAMVWQGERPFRIGLVREHGVASLSDIEEADRAREILPIMLSTITAIRWLHHQGLGHGGIEPSKVVRAQDGRWLLTDLNAEFAQPVVDLKDLLDTWWSAFGRSRRSFPPQLAPSIRARLPYNEATWIESLLGWTRFRRAELDRGDSGGELLDLIDLELQAIGSGRRFVGRGWAHSYGAFPGWDATVDKWDWKVQNEIVLSTQSDPELDLSQRLQLGVDDSWRQYIITRVADRLEASQQAVLEFGDLNSEQRAVLDGTGDPVRYMSNLAILSSYKAEGYPSADQLISADLERANQERLRILNGGVLTLAQVLMMTGIHLDETLYSLLRAGRLIAVVDHDELLFPTFQFRSSVVSDVVARASELQGASYPSWTFASLWYRPVVELHGQSLAEVLRHGDLEIAEATLDALHRAS